MILTVWFSVIAKGTLCAFKTSQSLSKAFEGQSCYQQAFLFHITAQFNKSFELPLKLISGSSSSLSFRFATH